MTLFSPFIRTPYNYSTDEASEDAGLFCKGKSLTKQSFKQETDINHIVKMFGVTGKVPVTPIEPQYGDFSGVSDYHSAMNQINAANEVFMALPAKLRAKFDHDPNALLNFLNNEANRDEAIELGLIDGQPVAAPIVSDVVETSKDPV
jgi:phage internal scaffolding protein